MDTGLAAEGARVIKTIEPAKYREGIILVLQCRGGPADPTGMRDRLSASSSDLTT